MAQLDTLGKRLRVARLGALERVGHQYSQPQLALAVGTSSQSISAWENDISPPTLETVAKLAGLLGVTPGWLAYGQEPRFAVRAEPVTEADLDREEAAEQRAARKKGKRA